MQKNLHKIIIILKKLKEVIIILKIITRINLFKIIQINIFQIKIKITQKNELVYMITIKFGASILLKCVSFLFIRKIKIIISCSPR